MHSGIQNTLTSPHRAFLVWVFLYAIFAIGCESRTQQPVATTVRESSEPTPSVTQPSKWPPDDRRHEVYTGSLKCADCHQKIFDEYFSQHPMGRSVRKCGALTAAAQSSLPAEFTAGNRQYSVDYTDESMTHTEEMRDAAGTIYSRSAVVDFAIGSGTRGYSFVSQVGGCLYQSSATWYSQGDKWDLSPGYLPSQHPGFGRRMTGECIFCHAGAVNHAEGKNRFESPVFSEPAIGCERCHGPGNDHAIFHSSAGGSGLVDNIVNPVKLDAARRDSVCFQCHLHGKERILRTSRKAFDFRPGDLITDVWAVLVEDAQNDAASSELAAVTQSEQMVASECYKNSSGKLGCISCHSPHSTPDATAKLGFYRRRCLNCHSKPEVECSEDLTTRLKASKEDSCILCHMPKAAASDVPHTAQTDHRVLKFYSSNAATTLSGNLAAFEPADFPLPLSALQRAKGLSLEESMQTKGEAMAAMDLLAPSLESGGDVDAMIAGCWTLLRLGEVNDSEYLANSVLQIDSQNELALEALAIVHQQRGDLAKALSYVERILLLAPWNYDLQAQKAGLLTQLDNKQQAISTWKKALEIDPLKHEGRESLIELLRLTNQASEAEAQAATLSRIRAVQQQ